MEINIFNGPKKEFENIIPSKKITLHEFVSKYDTKKNTVHVKTDPEKEYYEDNEKEHIECLVAFSENYAGITESAVQTFNNILNECEIEKIYLQNPPKSIIKLLEENYKNIEYENHEYSTLTKIDFLKINDDFDKRIIGQEKAKRKILVALYPLIKKYNKGKPITLMFYGNSGVGKTETAKFISDILGEKLFRKQFSMFQNMKFSEYLFGGSHMQSSFAKDLLERESNIILLDEFDKAANLFHEAFYQLFDEAIFEDNNYQVKLEDSIIICTSNYKNIEEIRKNIGDPLFYRFDSIIKFEDLSTESIERIIENVVNNKYEKLDLDDKKLINKTEITNLFKINAYKIRNSRQISNLIEEKINSDIIDSFIKNEKNES
ncbi:AAA family ATPase [uncultured Methanobrevibacter sp.]|uniref:AAA family ATPase n=1 Tax=uncultured Methanobrevibacter sp. TaxID=253161 RepID=UPI0025E24F70|nr:AAA family ATPase [uncultured Methanobrevibacter sp.]